MKTFDFLGHQICAQKVVAVGPVDDDAQLGCRAFVVYMSGGTELTFRELLSRNSNRDLFIREWVSSI